MRRINLANYRIEKAQKNLQESEDALKQDAQTQLEHAKKFVEEAENSLQEMIKDAKE